MTAHRECALPTCCVLFTPKRDDHRFHTVKCLREWQNLAKARGAQLYPLLYENRLQPRESKSKRAARKSPEPTRKLGSFAELTRLLDDWIKIDRKSRLSARSSISVRAAIRPS